MEHIHHRRASAPLLVDMGYFLLGVHVKVGTDIYLCRGFWGKFCSL